MAISARTPAILVYLLQRLLFFPFVKNRLCSQSICGLKPTTEKNLQFILCIKIFSYLWGKLKQMKNEDLYNLYGSPPDEAAEDAEISAYISTMKEHEQRLRTQARLELPNAYITWGRTSYTPTLQTINCLLHVIHKQESRLDYSHKPPVDIYDRRTRN